MSDFSQGTDFTGKNAMRYSFPTLPLHPDLGQAEVLTEASGCYQSPYTDTRLPEAALFREQKQGTLEAVV
jgi:hypothetical protein